MVHQLDDEHLLPARSTDDVFLFVLILPDMVQLERILLCRQRQQTCQEKGQGNYSFHNASRVYKCYLPTGTVNTKRAPGE